MQAKAKEEREVVKISFIFERIRLFFYKEDLTEHFRVSLSNKYKPF